jgi:hypothetical protein
LGEINTSWQCLLQNIVEWTTLRMAFENNDFKNNVNWGAQEVIF